MLLVLISSTSPRLFQWVPTTYIFCGGIRKISTLLDWKKHPIKCYVYGILYWMQAENLAYCICSKYLDTITPLHLTTWWVPQRMFLWRNKKNDFLDASLSQSSAVAISWLQMFASTCQVCGWSPVSTVLGSCFPGEILVIYYKVPDKALFFQQKKKLISFFFLHKNLILLLLNTTCPVLANSVDPDQLAAE